MLPVLVDVGPPVVPAVPEVPDPEVEVAPGLEVDPPLEVPAEVPPDPPEVEPEVDEVLPVEPVELEAVVGQGSPGLPKSPMQRSQPAGGAVVYHPQVATQSLSRQQ